MSFLRKVRGAWVQFSWSSQLRAAVSPVISEMGANVDGPGRVR